ncbi:unnamed protein product [Urochloa decumbens]|uniref:F-box domain-containing protein n=1 Tax=Urochloa decumbens TaxID=240449 RepID=A0ABC9DZZ0_9POAL
MISAYCSEYLLNLEIDKLAQLRFSMDNLPDALLSEIAKRLTQTSDLNSLSLVSKRLYTVEAEQRDAIRIGCGLSPVTSALPLLCSRFPNLCKLEFNYYRWKPNHGMQLDSQGLHVLSSFCPSLVHLTLSYCLCIDDTGLGFVTCFNKLMSLRLNTVPEISSVGLLSVAVGCKRLTAFNLIDCKKVTSAEWLEHLGRVGSLEELIVKYCKGISQYDFLKFGTGWMKLQTFVFQNRGFLSKFEPCDPSYVPHRQYIYDFSCDNLKDLTLARIITVPEIGLGCLLRKCKALENLGLFYVLGLSDTEIITVSHNCKNLRSISLRLEPVYNERPEGLVFSTPLTDDSLKALALRCTKLQAVELTFAACSRYYPEEIGFTQEGVVTFIQSCPIRDLVLSGANFFDDEGMKALSSVRYLKTLELMDCVEISNTGIRFLARAPCLINLTLRQCDGFTDLGVTEVCRARNLESLVIEGCSQVSLKAVEGAAKLVHFKEDYPGLSGLNRFF